MLGAHPLGSTLLAIGLIALPVGVSGEDAASGNAPTGHAPLFPITGEPRIENARKAFDEVRELILARYYTGEIDTDALYLAAIRGMLRHISPPGDPERAQLWPAKEYERIANSLKGVRTSAGIQSSFNQADGSLTVTGVAPGSPADGVLETLDRILRIDGASQKGRSVAEIDRLLHAAPGTKLRLTVVRDVHVLEIELRLEVYEAKDLSVAMLPSGVGYARVKRMSTDISADLRAAVLEFQNRTIDKLVVDLRGNPGGVFAEGLKLSEIFVGSGQPILRVARRGANVQTYVSSNDEPLSIALAVLVDDKTASASEMFARALQAHQVAVLVGTNTFGKATLEQTFTLDGDHRVKFIVGALYGPRGQSWYENGLQPDILVPGRAQWDPATLAAGEGLARDSQLRAAWQFLLRAAAAAG